MAEGLAEVVGNKQSESRALSALAKHWQVDKRFEPTLSLADAAARRAQWHEALGRSKNWIPRGQ